MEDTELRERLQSLAFRTAPPPQDADDLTDTVVSLHRARRRRQWAAAAAAVAAAVVLLGVPAVRSMQDRNSDPASPALPTGVYTTPTRGISADNEEFVEGLRRLPWTNGTAGDDVPEPPLDTRHVVWTGLVAGEQWALVAGADPDTALPRDGDGDGRRELDGLDRVAIAWFTGPRDGIAQEMTMVGVPRVVDARAPAALTDSGRGGVIVAAPDDRVEVSDGVRWRPDGTPRRDYELLPDIQGVAILRLAPVSTLDNSLWYGVIRNGERLTGPFDSFPNPDFSLPEIDWDHLRPTPPAAPGDRAVTAAVDALFGRTADSVDRVRSFTVLWAGDLATAGGGSARLTVLAVELPDGPFYITGALGGATGSGTTDPSTCGSEIRPAGTPPGELVVVLRCDADDGPGTLVVVAPSRATEARAVDDRGEQIASVPLVDGVAVVPVPAGLVSVAALDADGEVLDRRGPMGHVDWGG